MIRLSEQWGYNHTGHLDVTEEQALKLSSIGQRIIKKTYRRKKEDVMCLCVEVEQQEEVQKYHFETSYFIGVDWLVESKQAVLVEPKLNDDTTELDFLSMLFDALEEPENAKHLDDLFDVNFESPTIKIKQKEDRLTPFLVVEYMQLLRQIVRKGLKKSYYRVTQNLEAKLKGKILVNKTINKNVSKGLATRIYCQFDEFGVNSVENQILKKAFKVAQQILPLFKHKKIVLLQHIASYIAPSFEGISDNIDVRSLKKYKVNPIYKEYERALSIAICLLKKSGYNQYSKTSEEVETPPFWIDMSKLFELYVYKKLKDVFTHNKEVEYHIKSNSQEIDFLINSPSNNIRMVLDAKYKPRYENQRISTDDIRQISGYARMEKIYNKLNIDYTKVIDCLIIYSHQNSESRFSLEQFENLRKEKGYVGLYKLGIRLPVAKSYP